MANTTRLVLYKPVSTDLVDPVAAISDQMAIIDDQACKVAVTPLATPPIPLFTGYEWFTEDTHQWFFWNGSSWTEISLPLVSSDTAAGRLVFVSANELEANNTVAGGEESGPEVAGSCNVVSGRKYRVFAHTVLLISLSEDINNSLLRLRVAQTNGTVTTSGTLINTCHATFEGVFNTDVGSCSFTVSQTWTATFTGRASFGLFLAKPVGDIYSASFDVSNVNLHYLAVEEVTS